ncbi:hypothetical protein [Herbaspirillum sp. SJZ107]|uniref:hypothetical protein n=1 Tax=Herbaspirillum sp. SJZ107 TaxID=2572881 RepID=UPI0011521544|nr:hypothetical protein [Herbaspirillum sp. SJZ107]TQK00161.1 hypothetical protein FBX97_5826 [Herbaspirillum sp. SJZ107]
MSIWFLDNNGDDLITLRYAAEVLNVRLQAVVKLGLPRYMVAKKAAYKKRDVEAFLMTDLETPNALLRELQEEHRQVQLKQRAHPSTRYQSVAGNHLLRPDEAKTAKQASKANRKRPLSKDEVFGGWHSSLSLNKPVMPAEPMTEYEAKLYEGMRERVRQDLARAEEEIRSQSGPAWEMMKFKRNLSK